MLRQSFVAFAATDVFIVSSKTGII